MVDPVVEVEAHGLARGAQRLDPREGGGVDAIVETGVVDRHRRLHPGCLGGVRRGAVIRDRGVELVAGGDGQPVDEAAAPAEADRPDLASTARFRELVEHRHRIVNRLRQIELADRIARGVLVRGRSSGRREHVGRDSAKTGDREAAGDVADMVVEAPVLVDDKDGGLERTGARLGDIGLVAAGEGLRAGREALVVRRHDRRGSGRGGDPGDQQLGRGEGAGELDHLGHEGAALHAFMGEAIVEQDRAPAGAVVHRLHSAGCGWAACGGLRPSSAMSLSSISLARL